jgi:hypothetical protein
MADGLIVSGTGLVKKVSKNEVDTNGKIKKSLGR